MLHQPPGVRHRTSALAALALLTAVTAASPAAAETLLSGPDAPLIVQGSACVGGSCVSGASPSAAFVVRNSNTPLVRLDQTAESGFTPQVWDVAGNEANFFVRDLTADGTLPFRIFPGAPTSNLTLRDGRVGVGTSSPTAGLDVVGSSGATGLKVTERAPSVAARTLADLTNRGPVVVRLADSDAEVGWTMATAADGSVALTPEGPGTLPSLVLSESGDVTAGGVVRQTADPARQTGVRAADEAAIVEAIRTLPVERFGIAGDGSGAEHLAPNGAAFRTALGVGSDDALIAPGDVGAVALVGVKALLDREAAAGGPSGDLARALTKRLDEQGTRIDATGDLARALTRRADAHGSRIGSAEQVQHGHERRMRKLEHQASLAERRFQRSRRTQRRLDGQVAKLRGENARLRDRLAAVEAAVAKLR